MTQTIVVIAAHAFEARAMAGVARSVSKEPWGSWMLYRGDMWDIPLAVIRSGPGKVAAAAATQAAIQYLDPVALIAFGVAGSPDPRDALGTIAVADSVVDVALGELGELPVEIPDRFEPHAELRSRLAEVPGTSGATVLCWEGHVASPAHRPPGADGRQGMVVVDWESAAVAQVAGMWDVPWAAVKVISDHGEAERLRLLAVAAKRPLQWGAEVVRRGCHAYLRDIGAIADTEAAASTEESH